MSDEVEKLIKKSRYYEKRNTLHRNKVRADFSNKLKEWRIFDCELLTHMASSETQTSLSKNNAWKNDFRETCEKVFEVDYGEPDAVFNDLKESILALNRPAFFMYGSEWKDTGALAISNSELVEELSKLSFLLSHSFILSDDTGAKCLRFEADELGGKFTTAEVYVSL